MNFQKFKQRFQKRKVEEIPSRTPDAPLVSVCVQTYQHTSFIKDCLDGILIQETSFPFEILLGDDYSTDGTREICMEYAKKHPNKIRLFLHHRENNIQINGKPTGRFNFTYNLFSARGKYIALCEGDDYWTDPLKLQKQVDFLEVNNDYSICFHRTNILRNDTDLQLHPIPEYINGVFTYADLLSHYNFIITASVVFRVPDDFLLPKWFQQLPFGDLGLYQLLTQNKKIKCLSDIMSVYRIHSHGIYQQLDNQKKKITYLEFYKVIKRHLNLTEKEIVKKKRKSFINSITKQKFKNNILFQFFYKYYLIINY